MPQETCKSYQQKVSKVTCKIVPKPGPWPWGYGRVTGPPLLPTSSEDDSDEEYGDEVTDDENPEEVVDKYEDFQDSIDSYLDRLEKKLRRSSCSAADAEEICEELDDIENCVNNHGEGQGSQDRISRLREMADMMQSSRASCSASGGRVLA